jgi:hypothetical protein
MKLIPIIFFAFFLIYGCDSDSTGFVNENAVKNNKKIEIPEEDSDCVFDTSTYKFTTEALNKHYGKAKFIWDTSTSNALVPLENYDTLVLHIGGCNHFSFSAEFRTASSKFNDSAYVVQKCLWLAETFFYNGFDQQFSEAIRNNNFYSDDTNNKTWLTYSLTNTDSDETNNVYDGFGVKLENGRAIIFILGYIN